MEAFNEYVVVMEDRVEASRNDKKIESIGSEIKRLSEEHEVTKREGKRDAEKIEALTKLLQLRSLLRGPKSRRSRSRGIGIFIVLHVSLFVISRSGIERSSNP
ncbi:hypothetical protein Bca52824_053625 [Brassica carinata]|uniref:Uncharacterized protein n=1 Tax=Brassica carinata TaxID=52824 RepID=A0A8X7UJS9_BRACI|nr:hypothetical protein Bca52824_053625 [Brassica carinata]